MEGLTKIEARIIYLEGMAEAFDKLQEYVTSGHHRARLKNHQINCATEIKRLEQKINIHKFLNNKK
jgi:hypothetical protein